MQIIESLEWRYACKKFDTKRKLSAGQIDLLKKAFNLTATSFGLQPIKLLIIQGESLKEKLLPLTYYQQQTRTCSHLLVICIETQVNEAYIDAYFDREQDIRGTSVEIIDKYRGQLHKMFARKDQQTKEKEAVYQAYLALGNLMTVCALEGIDSCPMEGFMADKVDALLQLEDKGLRSVLLLPVGYRDENDFMSKLAKVRKPLEEVVLELD